MSTPVQVRLVARPGAARVLETSTRWRTTRWRCLFPPFPGATDLGRRPQPRRSTNTFHPPPRSSFTTRPLTSSSPHTHTRPSVQAHGNPAEKVITTELIQKYLDENQTLILAILENQNVGKLEACNQYQARLQQNLMYLAAIADAQPPSKPGANQA